MKILIPATVNKSKGDRFVPTDEATLTEINGKVAHTLTSACEGGGLSYHHSTVVIEGIMNEDVTCRIIGQMDNTIDHTFESANRVYDKEGLCPTIPTCAGGNIQPKVIVYDDYNRQIPKEQDVIGAITQTCGHSALGNGKKIIERSVKYRIRKLTPLECFRLMAVSDDDARKIMAVNSNSKCYQQAGDSIVVDVMCAMFRKLNIKGVKQNG